MARTALTAQVPLGSYPSLPLAALSAALTFAASDNANGNSVKSTGRELIVINNTDVGAQTVTITSRAVGPLNRTGDITTYSIPASGFAMLGPFAVNGWQQSDGNLYIDTSSANIKLAVIRLPAGSY